MNLIPHRLIKLFSLLCVIIVFGGQVNPVRSASDPVIFFHQDDIDGDGSPDQAEINCACVTDQDLILIIDGGGDMQPSEEWQLGTDTINDSWIFDIGGDGSANLIIVFRTEGDKQIAEVYDDVDENGEVSYQHESGHMIIDESDFWTLKFTASPGWVLENGHVNLNLQVMMDKPFPFGFEGMNEDRAKIIMSHDGIPDVSFDLVDIDNNNAMDYYLARLLSDFPDYYSLGQSKLYVNSKSKRSLTPDTAFFWPFLDFQPTDHNNTLRYFDHLPTIDMDWKTSTIQGFRLPGYPIEAGYHLNNKQAINFDQTNHANYEAPHAYYDLASNVDNYPEMNIRLFNPYTQDPNQSELIEIRYSWNQFNLGTLNWDYKLGLMGSQPTDDQTVIFQDFNIVMVPYERLPYWVTEKEWGLATFVANEGANRSSSEGIYTWTPWAGTDITSDENPSYEVLTTSSLYLSGFSERSPKEYFSDIWENYRGEYIFNHPSNTILYFSPIDQRLHLKGSEYGLMNMPEGRQIIFKNDDRDDYLEQWLLYETGQLKEQIYFIHSQLIYANDNEVVLKSLDLQPSKFETLPPRNHQEWQELGIKLPNPEENIPLDDFNAILGQFPNNQKDWIIRGATLREFRSNEDGFRFILDLQENYVAIGTAEFQLMDVQPGQYLVTFHDHLSITPLTPSEYSMIVNLPEEKLLASSESLPIYIKVLNSGLQDMYDLSLILEARNGFKHLEIERWKIDLLSTEPVYLLSDWLPDNEGNWEIGVKLENAKGELLMPLFTHNINIELDPSTYWNIFIKSTGFFSRWPAILVLISVAVLLTKIIQSVNIPGISD